MSLNSKIKTTKTSILLFFPFLPRHFECHTIGVTARSEEDFDHGVREVRQVMANFQRQQQALCVPAQQQQAQEQSQSIPAQEHAQSQPAQEQFNTLVHFDLLRGSLQDFDLLREQIRGPNGANVRRLQGFTNCDIHVFDFGNAVSIRASSKEDLDHGVREVRRVMANFQGQQQALSVQAQPLPPAPQQQQEQAPAQAQVQRVWG